MWDVITADFVDLSLTEAVTVLTRLLMAAILGGMLGYEREHQRKSAGIRTHMLVAIGSALFVIAPSFSGIEQTDLSRVLQGIIAGVGFLGAGTIIKSSDNEVRGLTTAAGIWLTAAIGVTVGMGRGVTAIISTILAILVLSLVPHLIPAPSLKRIDKKTPANESSDAD